MFDIEKSTLMYFSLNAQRSEMTLYILRGLTHYYYFVCIHIFMSLTHYDY